MKNVEDIYPLSPMQQGMLVHALYAPHSEVHIEQFQCVLQGPLQVEMFRAAWDIVMARHQALRTSFLWEELDTPLQVVRRDVTMPWQVLDWCHLTADEQGEHLQAFLRTDRQAGFDLTHAPVMRLTLMHCGSQTYHVVWSFHHIVLDGWSLLRVWNDVLASYEALSHGHAPVLLSPPPYRKYIDWLAQQDMHAAEAYWRQQLHAVTISTPMGTVRAQEQQEISADHYEEATIRVSREVTAVLSQLARRYQLTLHTLVQGAWALLLSRYSGVNDVLFGTVVSGRPATLAGADEMIGLFINTLPTRVQIHGEDTCASWLQRLQNQQAQARQYDFVPLFRLQQWSGLAPESPLFATLLVFENYPFEEREPDSQEGVAIRVQQVQVTERTLYPLSLIVLPGAELVLRASYDQTQFRPQQIHRLLQHLYAILLAFTTHLERPISALPLLSPQEYTQLVEEWSGLHTVLETPDTYLHDLLHAHALARPDAIAIQYGDVRIPYALLERQANQLAHLLLARDLGPEAIIAVCLQRSPWLPLALAAIWKAGACYLPLDPELPPHRLRFLLQDARPALILTQSSLLPLLDDLWSGTLICIDAPHVQDQLASRDSDRPQCMHESLQRAYVIYTSGSTGQPKGVELSYGSLAALTQTLQRTLQLTASDRILQFASLSFDASIFEIALAWGAGATLVLANKEELLPGEPLRLFLQEQAISQATLPPSALLVTDPLVGEQLHTLVVAGEACPQRLVDRWGAGRRVMNAYGPTEATIMTTGAWCHPGEEKPGIGTPIVGWQVYVLNEQGQPVPIGVVGELYIGGAGIARSYLGKADLTAERFVPHPWSQRAGARLYRTGDLVKWREDGTLEFVGRNDHQVKVRGFRIELGEIEAVLHRHPGVQQAVVLVSKEEQERFLAAYVQPKPHMPLTVQELRDFLKQRLPQYMVPATFLVMVQLPLTSSGKIDRQHLQFQLQASLHSESDDAYRAPRTSEEELLAGVWSRLLGVAQVGMHANFFELGGHSLLATQVISQVRALFHVELPYHQLFETPTIAELARVLRERRQEEAGNGQMLSPVAIVRPVHIPLSFAQQRLWFLEQLQLTDALYTVLQAYHLEGRLQLGALYRSVHALAARHEILRTTYVLEGEQPVQRILASIEYLPLTFSVVDMRSLPEHEQQTQLARIRHDFAHLPFDLVHGPLWRLTLVQLSGSEQLLLLALHHSLVDGWSLPIFFGELFHYYTALCTGAAVDLPALPCQYADFAVWQRTYLEGPILEKQLAYWRRQLLNFPDLLSLPTDHPRASIQSVRGAVSAFQLPGSLLKALKQVSIQENVTLFMVLLAGVACVLGRISGQDDLIIGTPIANRPRIEFEPLIGCFVNTLPLRVTFSKDMTGVDVLEQVRRIALEAYAHQDLPFERLVEELVPHRSLSHTPLFQVMLVLQNTPADDLTVPGVALRAEEMPRDLARFDLTFEFVETDQGIEGYLEYNRDLFEPQSILRIQRSLHTFLEGLVSERERPIYDIPLLSQDELRRLVDDWSGSRRQHERAGAYLHELLQHSAFARPEATAVQFQDQQLSYRWLDQRANQLAHVLLAQGLGAEDLIGVCLQRSPWLPLALAAIWKIGACYLPLDSQMPTQRLRTLLEDAHPRLLLSQVDLQDLVGALAYDQVLFLDDPLLQRRCEQASDEPVQLPIEGEQRAYVIYTSGSTGQPKGVELSYGSLAALTQALQQTLQLTSSDRILQFASLSFDASLFEVALAWGAGATLVLADKEELHPGEPLRAFLQEQAISQATLPPSAVLVTDPQGLEQLRTLVVAGEACPQRVVTRWGGARRLMNAYGPTEATIMTTGAWCHADEELSPSIGTPLVGWQVYVLDERGQPVPVGVVGELYIGGMGIARGYLGKADLTAERFVPHPWSQRAGARLYRTGDLVKWRDDATLEFVGRSDHQVKIRGFRIELGEIEAILQQYPGVRHALVVVKTDEEGDQRLFAYLLLSGPQEDQLPQRVRAYLKARLPAYMIPAAILCLDAFPLLPNGKIDLRALPVSEGDGHQQVGSVAPRDALEERLVALWTRLLHTEHVGITDNFFDVGGHSLLAIRLVTLIQQEWGCALSPTIVFQDGTIERLAATIRRTAAVSLVSPLVAIQPHGTKTPFFCVHPGLGGVWGYYNIARHLSPEQPFYGVQDPYMQSDSIYYTSLEEMATSYLQAIQAVAPHGPYLLGGWSFGSIVAFEMAQQLRRCGEEVALLAVIDGGAPELASENFRHVDDATLLAIITMELARDSLSLPLQELYDELRHRDTQGQVLYVLECLARVDQELAQNGPAWVVQQKNLFLRRIHLLHRYAAQPYPGPITLFRARSEDTLTFEQGSLSHMQDMGWGALSAFPLAIEYISGYHDTLIVEPHVQLLAERLQWQIDQALKKLQV